MEAGITTDKGVTASAMIPSGASTGEREAVELRDGDKNRYNGKEVLKAVGAVNGEIRNAVTGKEFASQSELDRLLIEPISRKAMSTRPYSLTVWSTTDCT